MRPTNNLKMKLLIKILILIFTFQSLVKSEDISDFEIEGMSIGDSALNFFSKNEIDNATVLNYDDDKFYDKEIINHESFLIYEGIQLSFKKNDNQFIIYTLSGFDFYEDNIDECFKKVDNVANEVSNLFENTKGEPVYKSHEGDPTGKSKVKSMDYWFENGLISIECWNWSEEITDQKGWVDNFGITIFSNEHLKWLNNKAYN